MLGLNNPRVARHYACTVEKDRVVHVHGIYSGALSNIGIAAARAMVEQGCDLIRANDSNPDPGSTGPDEGELSEVVVAEANEASEPGVTAEFDGFTAVE